MQNLYSDNKNFTIGIEEEYMICNTENGELINKADSIMELINKTNIKEIPNFHKRFSYELILSEIETNTSPHLDLNNAISELSYLRKFLKKAGAAHILQQTLLIKNLLKMIHIVGYVHK